MNKRNYQKELDKLILDNDGDKKVLLLHGCCAPCSSYCLEYLDKYFIIKLLYYNPNISSAEEYDKRLKEVHRLVDSMYADGKLSSPIQIIDGRYEPSEFFTAVKGYEKCPEGGDRCKICYELRMREAAIIGKAEGADYFTTTLSISPLKKSDVINDIGEQLAKEIGIMHLPSDFKKREGYKRSIELSREYELYRQNYCGCIFSKNVENDK